MLYIILMLMFLICFLTLFIYIFFANVLLLAACMSTKSLQLCSTLCDPMDFSLLGSSVHGILQARILEWVAIASSMGSSQPRDRNHVYYISCFDLQMGYLLLVTPGKPLLAVHFIFIYLFLTPHFSFLFFHFIFILN